MLLGDGYLKVDPYFRLFWASATDTENVQFMNTIHPPGPSYPTFDNTTPFELYPTLVHHTVTGEVPVAVHLNDYWHKHYIEEWYGRLWWTSERKRFWPIVRERMEKGTIKFATEEGITEESARSVCPNLPIWKKEIPIHSKRSFGCRVRSQQLPRRSPWLCSMDSDSIHRSQRPILPT
ncbi:hypothetical protein BD324DRAFT_51558 [Kockovaella imperatae]|uniref:Uncharacterized protein n=1 Tax=Kockovaella imperatae TaxID=4999 RepID=A0A1Y1UTE9_9TREE|nr:hypothetical protein BD324DRAFT_51558 [Kockovaella imperatae]ORX41232.1 hypothetical protein BD324DRAFT_51558 [Kockovaella imperatae]